MIDRINKNEEKLDIIIRSINNLEESLDGFKQNIPNIKKINKYYGSKTWFKDKEAYENNKIPKIKAGILSEDTVWNMLEDINNLKKDMKIIIKLINSIQS